MKKIILNFIGTGINNEYQACINIYDTCGNLIYQGKTYNGKLIIYLEEENIYKLVATSCCEQIKTYFYVDGYQKKYTFIFGRSIFTPQIKTITFLLRDANYNNLPIEKGEMFLWQK